jgi:hypothetical protein
MSCAASPTWGHHVLSHCHTVREVVVPCPVTQPRCKWSVVWHRPVELSYHFSQAYAWSIGPALHCVCLFAHLKGLNGATCLHVL